MEVSDTIDFQVKKWNSEMTHMEDAQMNICNILLQKSKDVSFNYNYFQSIQPFKNNFCLSDSKYTQ